jgi:hypothetical protein
MFSEHLNLTNLFCPCSVSGLPRLVQLISVSRYKKSFKSNILNVCVCVCESHPVRAGQVLLSQVYFGQDKYGPLPLRVHLTDQVCDDAALRIH